MGTMSFQFFDPSNNNNNSHQNGSSRSWNFKEHDLDEISAAHWPLIAFPQGSWVQIMVLPSQQAFPLAGVAVGTYLLVLQPTPQGAVRVQVMGQTVTLSRAIAQKVYVRPLHVDPNFLRNNLEL